MKRYRLAFITRRFWPLVGGAERAMANLACEFQRGGHSVQVLTARWERSWPTEIVHREVPVHRLTQPKTRTWGTLRYMQSLGRWLRQHRQEIDGILVSMLRHDAHVAVHVGQRLGIPVVIRADRGGVGGDCRWQESARFGLRIREMTRQAEAWVASSPLVYDEMIECGYLSERGHLIPQGVTLPRIRTKERRELARRALAEAHGILTVGPHEPLVVYTGRLTAEKGLFELIDAWLPVVKRWPHAKLWLIGEGRAATQLWQLISSLELSHSIILPGSFDDPTEVFYAADVFVLPSYEEGMSQALLEAMAAGVPIVASDIPGNRRLVESDVHALLIPPRDPSSLAAAIAHTLENSRAAQHRAQAARERVKDHYLLETMAERQLEIIRQVIESRPTSATR